MEITPVSGMTCKEELHVVLAYLNAAHIDAKDVSKMFAVGIDALAEQVEDMIDGMSWAIRDEAFNDGGKCEGCKQYLSQTDVEPEGDGKYEAVSYVCALDEPMVNGFINPDHEQWDKCPVVVRLCGIKHEGKAMFLGW